MRHRSPHHSLGWLGINPRVVHFVADLLFNAFADSERSIACRGMIQIARFHVRLRVVA
jgi:hypothetical protein